MPSAGTPIDHFWKEGETDQQSQDRYKHIELQAAHAMKTGMFGEWLESFVGAWNHSKDSYTAANAGIIEWDM